MQHPLAWKLTAAFLVVALTAAGLVSVLMRLATAGQLDRLVIEQQRSAFRAVLVDYYAANGTWRGLAESLFRPDGDGAFDPGGGHGPGRGPRRNRAALFALADSAGHVIIPVMPDYPPGTIVSPAALRRGEPVEVDGQVVGTILTAAGPPGLTAEEAAFLQRANRALLLAGAGAVLVALALGGLLARSLTRPLRDLTQATRRMAGGALEQEVAVSPGDEIGELASAFNEMSRAVARANQARRQMTADVAHELRTPLTVIAGYIESMRDGVLAPSPERLAVIQAEIEHLQHLVGDLRTLSQADAGELKLNKQPAAPADLLQQAAAAFGHQAAQKGVRLEVAASGALPAIQADETRLAQVMSNLLSNALRYTPAGGRVTLGAERRDGGVTLSVQDTGPGIAPEDLPLVFNRLYRADKSRAEAGGESGLGLAIAKALVEAHGGQIEARSAPGEGATFLIHLR